MQSKHLELGVTDPMRDKGSGIGPMCVTCYAIIVHQLY